MVAARYRVSHDAVSRHIASHLGAVRALVAQSVASAQAEQQQALDVMGELRRVFERVNLVMDACDRWLRDPEDPTRYDVGPRAGDVTVIYLEADDQGKSHQRKAPLDQLLVRLTEAGIHPTGWESKQADPRELILKAAAQLRPSIELLAKLVGELDERPTINIALSPEWQATRTRLVAALGPYPDARAAVVAALAQLEAA